MLKVFAIFLSGLLIFSALNLVRKKHAGPFLLCSIVLGFAASVYFGINIPNAARAHYGILLALFFLATALYNLARYQRLKAEQRK